MKVQCLKCKEIVGIRFRVVGAGIQVTCGACSASYHVAETRAATAAEAVVDQPSAPPADAAMSCPKCGSEQPPASACRVCGLAADRFAAWDAAHRTLEPRLEAAWRACLAAWHDAGAHERFLERVAAQSAYSDAARRYRARLRDHGGDATDEARLARIAKMAEAALLSRAVASKDAANDKEPYRGVLLMLIMLVVLGGAGATYMLLGQGNGEHQSSQERSSRAAQLP